MVEAAGIEPAGQQMKTMISQILEISNGGAEEVLTPLEEPIPGDLARHPGLI